VVVCLSEIDVYIYGLLMYSLLMRRTQIYIDEDLDSQLRTAAAAEGRSAAALIRDAVRLYLADGRGPERTADPLLELAGAFEGGPRDASTEHDRYLYGDAPRL
jgi:plasmid stability protein